MNLLRILSLRDLTLIIERVELGNGFVVSGMTINDINHKERNL